MIRAKIYWGKVSKQDKGQGSGGFWARVRHLVHFSSLPWPCDADRETVCYCQLTSGVLPAGTQNSHFM